MNASSTLGSAKPVAKKLAFLVGLLSLFVFHPAMANSHDDKVEPAAGAADDKPEETPAQTPEELAAATKALAEQTEMAAEQMKEADRLVDELAAANKIAQELLGKNTNFSLGGSRDYEAELGLLGVYKLNTDVMATDFENTAGTFRLGKDTRIRFVRVVENKPDNPDDDEYWVQTDCSYLPVIGGECKSIEKRQPEGQFEQHTSGPTLYRIPKKDLQQGKFRLSNAIDHGVLLVPFKYRTEDKSLSGAATLGYFVGARSDTLLLSGTFYFSVGTSLVPVERVNASTMATEVEEVAAATVALGMSFSTKSNFQVSINVGVDHVGGSAGDDWKYEDDHWFSIGLGYGFLQR